MSDTTPTFRQPRAAFALVGLTLLSLIAALAFAPAPASADTVMRRPLIKAFDGSDTTAGKFQFAAGGGLQKVAVDTSTGTAYVLDYQELIGILPFLDRFNAAGEAQNWPATGESSLPLSPFDTNGGTNNSIVGIAVDNTAGPSQGRIYLAGAGIVKAVAPSGELLPWVLDPPELICGIAVDAEGHLWVRERKNPVIREYASSGSPPAQIGQLEVPAGKEESCHLAFDAQGDVYISETEGDDRVDKYVGGAFSATLDPFATNGLALDQSKPTGVVFVAHNGNFTEYDSSGSFAWNYGEGLNGETTIGIGSRGIAHNPALDRVYVLKGFPQQALIFGPPESLGAVPDVAIEPTTSDSVETAHLSGTINPLGLENSYHFQYKANGGGAWTSEDPATPSDEIAPPDSETHEVSFDLTGLEPFTDYQVRLVATNEATGVVNVSAADRFRTGKFALLTIDSPSEPKGRSAEISGTVDPGDSKTTWRFQTSEHAECLSGEGFVDRPSQTIEANEGQTAVEEEMTGLVPNSDYCVRLAASNSPGTALTEIKQFTTDAVPPVLEGRGAAPRTETGARLNAYLNPEHSATTYRFELSEDGGASWIAQPDKVQGPETSSVLVSEEMTGLDPATSYSFRLSAESVGGTAQSQTQSFETLTPEPAGCPNDEIRLAQRTTHLGACRAIELVNNPDKGNQNVESKQPSVGNSQMSADGEELLWQVNGGAPGAPNGAGSPFLAQRSATGWHSQSVAPPAAEQHGGGSLIHFLEALTPDFGSFLLAARRVSPIGKPGPLTAVRVRAGEYDPLATDLFANRLDLSDDGEHVLYVNAQKQIEDIGAAHLGTGEEPDLPGEVVSLMPGGSPSQCGIGNIDPDIATDFGALFHPGYHWIATEDASRVYFRTRPDGECAAPPSLYVRNREAGQTTLIGGPASFIRATPDGRQAYFSTSKALDPADTDAKSDLYRWDEAAGESSCLTCVAEVPANVDTLVTAGEPVVRVSDDFSRIYFTSREQLVFGQGLPPAELAPDSTNLYVLAGNQISFVAVVDDGEGGALGTTAGPPELSEDGSVLVFQTTIYPQTIADQLAPECHNLSGTQSPCREILRYEDADRSLECISCDHAGATTHSMGTPALDGSTHFHLSADGATVAFATSEALLEADVNGDTDVYEWRNGATNLITDGVSSSASGLTAHRVIEVDGDGSDVAFAIVPPGGSLTGFEQDFVANLYDARIGGGFEPPSPEEQCEGDACQGPLVAPPVSAPPVSSDFKGRGNVAQQPPSRRRCAKGKRRVRRKGKAVCVKPRGRNQKRRAKR